MKPVGSSRATTKIIFQLVAKNRSERHYIYMKHFVGGGGVQNRDEFPFKSIPVESPLRGSGAG